jgi:hypothetical protein
MLIEIWERLRGYDKWVETEATVESSTMKRTAHVDDTGVISYTYDSNDVLSWSDGNGEEQRGYFRVPDTSRLYQLVGGEVVRIRFDPANPARFYFPELLRTRVSAAAERIKLFLVLLLVCIPVLFFWMAAR